MFAILDAKSHKDPSYVVDVAHFYANVPAASPMPLFTYEITNPDGGDNWLFNLRSWDAPQSSIPLHLYPTLQSVHYNFATFTLSGNCTLPDGMASNTTTSAHSCMLGTFNPNAHLQFNITSSIPLNTTLSAAYPAGVANATTNLAIPNKRWTFQHYAPALNLRETDGKGQLGDSVLQAAVTKPRDVTELKVCVNGMQGGGSGMAGAEVLAPLGLVLMRQADYALLATTPKKRRNSY